MLELVTTPVYGKLDTDKTKHNFNRRYLPMLNISQIVKKTEDMFDIFNAHFYNGELSRPAITVSPDGGARRVWMVQRV